MLVIGKELVVVLNSYLSTKNLCLLKTLVKSYNEILKKTSRILDLYSRNPSAPFQKLSL